MPAFTVIQHDEISGSSTGTWSKSSIPSSYDHLMLKISLRSDVSDFEDYWGLRLNSDSTASKYSYTNLHAYGTTVASSRAASGGSADGFVNMVPSTAATATADTYSSQTIWIPHYANTTNYKQVLSTAAVENASTTENRLVMEAGLFADTAAIHTVLVMNSVSADNFVQYSTFTLYGVTGA